MSKKWKNRLFEWLFWVSIVAGLLLMSAVFWLGWQMYSEAPEHVDVGVVLATGALALFTALLWFAAAITARFARTEISTSTAVSSANLTLALDNRFNSDRALRIRHGAVMCLAEKRDVHIDCDLDISPYRLDLKNRWYGLSSDLIDLFNYFDWIGYLTSDESNAIDRDVLRRKLGPWIINYYQMCEEEIDDVQQGQPDRWVHLDPLYCDLLARRKKWYSDENKSLPDLDNSEELDAFLQREHVRSHRGSH
ncbi:MAG TPA: hypothetical protein VHM69_17575 [Rubrobacter sp.]|nr:hypothetical protein [Rubrobacter sp.]